MREPGEGLVAGTEAPPWLARVGDAVARAIGAIGLERSSRLAATAVVPLLLPEGGFAAFGPLVAGLSAYVLLTALAKRDRYLRAADIVVAAVLLAAGGAAVIAFLPFVLVTVAGPASLGGVRAGLAAGGTLAIVLLVRLLATGEFAALGADTVIPISLLLPLVGLTSAAATDVLEGRAVRDRRLLREANRLLNALRDLAEDIPGGLDVSTVSAALLAELRAVPGTEGSLVLVEDHGMFRVTAAEDGARPNVPVRMSAMLPLFRDDMPTHTPRALPAALADACSDQAVWVVLPLGDAEEPIGALLAGFADRDAARRARRRLLALAADGRLALDNARLFDGTRMRAADAARRSVAGDLHDGVAQSLAHLRIELELRARDPDEDPEIGRLARIADTALSDLRSTIAGLRAPLDHDLGALLARHIDDLRSPNGPRIVFHREGSNRLEPERAEDVLRVAQEAISNALRHADAATIEVVLVQEDAEVRLIVRDDGIGPGTPSPMAGGGLGLRSMRERADRLAGVLEIEPRRNGGTLVVLTLPPRLPTTRRGEPVTAAGPRLRRHRGERTSVPPIQDRP